MNRLAVVAVAAALLAACGPRDPGPILTEVTPQGPAAVTMAP